MSILPEGLLFFTFCPLLSPFPLWLALLKEGIDSISCIRTINGNCGYALAHLIDYLIGIVHDLTSPVALKAHSFILAHFRHFKF